MKKIFIFCICMLLIFESQAQFFIQNSIQKSEITTGDYGGTIFGAGIGYNISKYFSVSLNYEINTANGYSSILGNLRSNDSVIVTAAFHSEPTNIAKATVYNVHGYDDALAILKEKPDRVTYSTIKIGLEFKPMHLKKHEIAVGLNLGISKIVTSMYVQGNNGYYTPAFSIPEHVIIVTPYFSNILDVCINPALKYYYHISPTVDLGCTFNVDYFYYSGDYNWNAGIVSRINLHKYKKN